MRIFLANYLFNRQEPIPINEVHRVGMGDSITKAYRIAAGGTFDPKDYYWSLRLRPEVLRRIAANGADINFVKTHNVQDIALGIELIPPAMTKSAIYIVRNPLDVVISYARHYGNTLEEAVEAMGRDDNTTLGSEESVKQFLGSWSKHVKSWTKGRKFPVTTLRYEDMETEPEKTFAKALKVIGMPIDDERLERAIRFSSFRELKGQEEKSGFIERSQNNENFFHTGRSGQWKDTLSEELIERMKKAHQPMMKRFGYL